MKAFLFSLPLLVIGAFASDLNCLVDQASASDCEKFSQVDCENAGCCWHPLDYNPNNAPWCYKPSSSSVTSYTLVSIDDTATGFEGVLQLKTPSSSVYGADITSLKLEVLLESDNYARIKITDSTQTRWEVPQSIVQRPIVTSKANDLGYKFQYTNDPFTFEIIRTSDGASIFKSSEQLIFKDQYIQFSTSISTDATTFGMGESTRLEHALQPGNTYTLWAVDVPAAEMYNNLYGSFPQYLQMVDGKAHGAMLMNSNGMDISISAANDEITYKVIGGLIDLYVFVGSTPKDVVSQFSVIVGKPMMQPYWSLGFHNCKYGYTSIDEVEDVVAGYQAAGINLDTQWMDIDYMDAYRDFTTNATAFPMDEVTSFTNQLHNQGMSFVVIIDPGIMVYDYPAYNDGLNYDLFIKDISGGNYLGQVWPGPVYFPDFTHPKSQDYWTNQLRGFYDQVPVDGFWIDMNEVSNFCNDDGSGQVCVNSAPSGCPAPGASQTDCCLVCSSVDTSNSLDFPPYAIHSKLGNGRLSVKTMSMSAQSYGNVSVYNMHNLYGISEQIATHNGLTEIRNKRPFLLTRSSFLGSGKQTAKWTGDNAATWNDLKSSIISNLDFNIFGIPMVGADICGFIGATTEELCARWIEVGAFYSFSRNHNSLGEPPQELYLWDSVTVAAKKALGIRYQLLPFMYTLLYDAHTMGATFTTPLFFNFPGDEETLHVDEQFMLGESVLVSPALYEGQTEVKAYFPQGYWYSVYDLSLMPHASKGGKTITLPTAMTEINVHYRGGSIIPLQGNAMTTTVARTTPFNLVAALCPENQAQGTLFWDDGEQIELSSYIEVSYSAEVEGSEGEFFATATITGSSTKDADFAKIPIGSVTVVGKDLQKPGTNGVFLNGKKLDTSTDVVYDQDMGTLTFSNLEVSVSESFKLTWS